MSTRDLEEVYAAETQYRLCPHRQPQARAQQVPVVRRNDEALTVQIADLIPRATLDALYMIASPSSLIH